MNAEQVADDDPAMQFTVEQISVMRKAGLQTSNQTDAPDPALYSRGAVRDFRSKGFVAKYWNFVDQYRHLPKLHEYVRCIGCNAKANRDGISRPAEFLACIVASCVCPEVQAL